MYINESLPFFKMAMVSYYRCIAEKGGICYVSKPEEVWHLLVLRPLGCDTKCRTLFGQGRGAETPLSLILTSIFVAYFSVFLYTIVKGSKRHISLKVIEPLAPFQTIYANKEEVPYYVKFEPRYTSSKNMQFTAMVPLPIIDDMIEMA